MYENQIFNSIEQFNNFNHKQYLSKITINFESCDRIFNNNNNSNNNNNNQEQQPTILENITSLNFIINEHQYNKSLNNIKSIKQLPQHITSLNVPSGFDLDLIKDLNKLQYLRICNYNSIQLNTIQDQLPKSIHTLELVNYEYPITRALLSSNTRNCSSDYGVCNSNSINYNGSGDSGCKKLILNYFDNRFKVQIESIPESVQSLYISSSSYPPDLLSSIFKFNNQLVHLKIGFIGSFDLPSSSFRFPESLTYLYIGIKSLPKGFRFPKGLKHLDLRLEYFSNPDKVVKLISRLCQLEYLNLEIEMESCKVKPSYDCSKLPKSLKRLQTSNIFGILFKAQLLPNQLPPNLEYLSFNECHINQFTNNNKPLTQDKIFPASLLECHFDSKFNQPIGPNTFPKEGNLRYVYFGDEYNQPIPSSAFPSTLQTIFITNHHYEHSPVISTTSNPFIECKNDFKKRMKYYYLKPTLLKSITLDDKVKIGSGKSLIFSDDLYSLKNKINLEKICIDWTYSGLDFKDIYEHLPKDNNIKFISILSSNNFTINLEQFQKLETIDIGVSDTFISTLYQDGHPNLYNLKSILIPTSSASLLIKLNKYLYPIIKFY